MAGERVLTIDATRKMTAQVNDTDVVIIGAGIAPGAADSTQALYVTKADAVKATAVAVFDTQNSRLTVGGGSAPGAILDVIGGGGTVPPLKIGTAALVTGAAITNGAIEYLSGSGFYITDGGVQSKISTGVSLTGFTKPSTNYNVALGVGTNTQALMTGASNVIIGGLAGAALAGGTSNVLIGKSAGTLLTAQGSNTFVGCEAGSANAAIQSGNTFIGYQAGLNSSGQYSVALGYQAFQHAAGWGAGDYEVAIGYQAMFSSRTATNSIAIGNNAGRNLGNGGEGSDNVVLGTSTAYSALTKNSVILGPSAGYNADGDSNIAIGVSALYANVTASACDNNIAIGTSALSKVTTCINNVAIGNGAGLNVTSASEDVFIGHGAGTGITTQTGQVIIGWNAGLGSGGIDNTLIGRSAGGAISAATTSSVAVGAYAAYFPSGTGNVAIGYHALYGEVPGSTTAAYNVAIGYNALDAVSTGQNSVALGQDAGGAITTGSNNVFIGKNAGLSVTTGGDNVAIGLGSTIAAGISSAVAVGSGATAINTAALALGLNAIASASSAIQIGAGTNSTASTAQVGSALSVDITNARLRVGDTAAPAARLSVKEGAATIPTLLLGSGKTTAGVDGAIEYVSTEGFYITDAGVRTQIPIGGPWRRIPNGTFTKRTVSKETLNGVTYQGFMVGDVMKVYDTNTIAYGYETDHFIASVVYDTTDYTDFHGNDGFIYLSVVYADNVAPPYVVKGYRKPGRAPADALFTSASFNAGSATLATINDGTRQVTITLGAFVGSPVPNTHGAILCHKRYMVGSWDIATGDLTVVGPSFTASATDNILAIWHGERSLLVQKELFFAGQFAQAAETRLCKNYNGCALSWHGGYAYYLGFDARPAIAGAGAGTAAKVNVTIQGNPTLNSNTDAGIEIPLVNDWNREPTFYYTAQTLVARDFDIDVSVTAGKTTTYDQNLSVILLFCIG